MSAVFEHVRARLRRSPTRRTAQLLDENRQLREALATRWPETEFVGSSPPAEAVRLAIDRCGKTDLAVLIVGEHGVGKRLVARLIHAASGTSGPFVAVSCGTLPRKLIGPELFGLERGGPRGRTVRRVGRLELADRGTLFLDEISEIPPDVQRRLLSFLRHDAFRHIGRAQRIPVQARLIASTSQDLGAAVRARLFGRELYARFTPRIVRVPSLRERWEDIPVIAEWFLAELGQRPGMRRATLDEDARKSLLRYGWPGNVRELQDVLVRASLISPSGQIRRMDLPREIAALREGGRGHTLLPPGLPLKDIERLAMIQTLEACRGNRAEAARRLGLSKKGFYLKMKRLGI
jgi:DNA-binding NtrC family response regulator